MPETGRPTKSTRADGAPSPWHKQKLSDKHNNADTDDPGRPTYQAHSGLAQTRIDQTFLHTPNTSLMEICCLSRSSDSVSSALCCGLCLSVGPRWDSGWTVLQIGTSLLKYGLYSVRPALPESRSFQMVLEVPRCF
eukprot:jgi/Chrzof1/5991/UNPLg00839.t1